MTSWKHFFATIVFTVSAVAGLAQIQPYHPVIGGTGSLRIDDGGSRLAVELNLGAQAWVLLDKRWGLGVQMEGGYESAFNRRSLSIGPMARFYLRNQADGWLPFLFATPAYLTAAGDYILPNPLPGQSFLQRIYSESLLLRGGIGVSRFITPSVLVELMLVGEHSMSLDAQNFGGDGNVSLTVGFQFILPPLK